MIKKLLLATIASLVLLSWTATADRPDRDLRKFKVVMSGVISTPYNVNDACGDDDGCVVSGPANFGNNRRAIDFSLMPFKLEDYWRHENTVYKDAPAGGGAYCFPEEEIGATPYIQIYEIKGGGMGATFYFKSPSENEVKYMLTLTNPGGAFPDGDFEMDFVSWEMETEGRGQKRKSACTGSGAAYVNMIFTEIEYP